MRGESLFAPPLIARLSTETAAFMIFGFFVASLFVSGCIQTSLLLLIAVVFTVVSLSVICCCPSRPFHSLTSASPAVALPFSRLFRLSVAVVRFLVVLLFRRRPLIRSLQLVVANVGLPLVFTSASHSQCRLVFVLRVPQERYKSSHRPARYLKQTSCCCAHCNEVVTCPS